jgi:uncharacterized protein YndB with AHSA1/START domain
MARNTIHVDAPPDAVFDVLADPRFYGHWVVGASQTLDVDGPWPEPGAVLHHSQFMVLRDTTTVLESEPGRRLVLEARARPAAVATVILTLEPEDGGTHLVLEERITGGLAAAVPRPVSDVLMHVRNREAVSRLKRLAELGRGLGRA